MSRYPVIVFDLDGTLLRGSSVSLFLAEVGGYGEAMRDLELRFRAGEISNAAVADASATWFEGQTQQDVWVQLESASWIEGIGETLHALAEDGSHLLLGTVTWKFAAEMLQSRYPFEAVCGTEMEQVAGVLTGTVSRYFDEHDKAAFVKEWCAANGYDLSQVAAIGDSRSDVPLFAHVGLAIALNATPDARAAADHIVDTSDLRDVLPLLIATKPAGSSAAPVEREAKLLLAEDAELPPFDSPGTLVTIEPGEHLLTTYWDTAQHVLARRGQSLRSRQGKEWTAKRRGHTRDLIVTRPERHFEGNGTQPPRAAICFLELGDHAGTLEPIVQLSVRRERRYIRDGQRNAVLLDVIDDRVEVIGRDRIRVGGFREIELEVMHDGGDQVLALLLDRIARSGITPAEPMSKYDRALTLLDDA